MPEMQKEIRCPFCGEANFFPIGETLNHFRPCAGDGCKAEWLIDVEVADFLDDERFVTHIVSNVGTFDDEENGVEETLHAVFRQSVT